ncbi:hypothetical protein IKG49_00780 [Candidatus Saccharibacteria bacterium]|nr:hypothetical protein [Candidatus Saccharibacteria bacterium]
MDAYKVLTNITKHDTTINMNNETIKNNSENKPEKKSFDTILTGRRGNITMMAARFAKSSFDEDPEDTIRRANEIAKAIGIESYEIVGNRVIFTLKGASNRKKGLIMNQMRESIGLPPDRKNFRTKSNPPQNES